jgi:hypothetical protein
MPDSLLTPRDMKALVLLLNARIDGERSATTRAPWEAVRKRLQGDLTARPKSMASSIAALLNSSRAGQLDEVDRVAKGLASALFDHGDIEGSKLLGKVVEAKYERPKPPAPAPQSRGGGSSRGDGGVMSELPMQPIGDTAGGAIEWFMPRDMRGEVVLDAHTGPAIERLVAELRLAEVFLESGVDAPTRALFSGPPGTGKTTIAKHIGGCLGLPVAVARLDGVVSSFMGETTQKVRKVFAAATSRRCLIFLDEIDGLCTSREGDAGGSGAENEMRRVTSSMLQQLDLLPQSQIVIAATNFPNRIDPALRSRLSHEVAFRNPDPDARRMMTTKHWAKLAHAPDAMTAFVAGTDGKSGRFIRATAMGAARAALLEASTLGEALASLEGKIDLATVSHAKITVEHVKAALDHAKKSGEA